MDSAQPPQLLPSTSPTAEPATVPTSRFCRGCGSPWDPLADACGICARLQPREAVARQQYDLERRSISSAIWLYFALLTVSIGMISVLAIDRHLVPLHVEWVAAGALSVLIVAWAIAQRSLLFSAFCLPKFGWMALGVPVGIVTFLAAHTILGVLQATLGMRIIDSADDFRSMPNGVIWGVVTVCLQPAFFEELGFRGVIQPSLQRVLTSAEAITVTALMFGILHLSVLSLPHLVAMGWMAGWMRSRSGSLYPAMIVHFTHNLLVLGSDWNGGLRPW